MTSDIKERQNVFFDMEAYLPKKNGYEPSDFLLKAPTPCWGVKLTGQGETGQGGGDTFVPAPPTLGRAAVLPL